MILVDTNVISESRRPDGNARVKLLVDAQRTELSLSAVVVGELRYGIERLPAGARRNSLLDWYAGLTAAYADRIFPVTVEVAELWGIISAAVESRGRNIDAPDGLIAATALHHDLTLWTRNTHDFAETGARLFNPWED